MAARTQPVYEAFDRIFDCRGHGWANLQSVHLNLPFGDDDEFGRLHAAIRSSFPCCPLSPPARPSSTDSPPAIVILAYKHTERMRRRFPPLRGR